MTMLEAEGLQRPTLADLQTLKMENSRSPGWLAHYFYVAGLVLLAICVLSAGFYCCYYYYVFVYKLKPKFFPRLAPLSQAVPEPPMPDIHLPHYQQNM